MLPVFKKLGNGFHRPRTVKRDGEDDILDARGLHLDEQLAHAAGFELEYAVGLAGGD